MASLRDIKTRIGSVKATQQITSAMQMVASIKLQQAERKITRYLPYKDNITKLLDNFLSSETKFKSAFEEVREINRVAVVVFSANMSLCGAFNANATRKLLRTIKEYKHLGDENILIYTIGKKTDQAIRKMDIKPKEYNESVAQNPDYVEMSEITSRLMQLFLNKEIDKVEIIYHQYRSKGVQMLVQETLLPISFEAPSNETEQFPTEYIIEPNREALLNSLVPKVIKTKMYSALLESYTSEQAARNMAMQTATDNADDMLDDLSLQYNKSRQQSITNELLDIIGATFK